MSLGLGFMWPMAVAFSTPSSAYKPPLHTRINLFVPNARMLVLKTWLVREPEGRTYKSHHSGWPRNKAMGLRQYSQMSDF